MSDRRATLGQARDDLALARERVEETYYEWAAQLAREAASDALALVEAREGLASSPPGEVGTLRDRVERLLDDSGLDSDRLADGQVLDDVLDPTLEPDYDPGLARREGGSEDYTTREDAVEAIEAAERIVDAVRSETNED
jgi:HEPN domain-containing protein